MNRKWSVVVAAALSSTLFIACASAADGGLYLGAGVGQGTVKDSSVDFDSNDTSYKAFVGYRFTAIPLVDLAVEGGYVDFGKPSQTALGQNVQYKVEGWNAAGLLIFPLGPLDFYGKAGALSWSWERSVAGAKTTKSGSNAFYGAGVGFRIWKIGVRAEYERFDAGDLDRLQMYSVSGVFQF